MLSYDGVLAQKVRFEGDEMVVGTSQPGRAALLENNARHRAEGDLRKTDGIRLAMVIPTLDYMGLVERNPELKAKDAQTRKRAWEKFLRSDESLIYRVK